MSSVAQPNTRFAGDTDYHFIAMFTFIYHHHRHRCDAMQLLCTFVCMQIKSSMWLSDKSCTAYTTYMANSMAKGKPTNFCCCCGHNNGNAVSHLALHFQYSITIESNKDPNIPKQHEIHKMPNQTSDGREREMHAKDAVVEIEMKQNAMETNVDVLLLFGFNWCAHMFMYAVCMEAFVSAQEYAHKTPYALHFNWIRLFILS